ncbi:MAG: bifunctional 4-hydroxy-3-methylbut-2-enyl diphosphate reductase/30S ribosomal protein S1 [Candidatus Saccharibacteria bacterium]
MDYVQVFLADDAGFCHGVRRAMDLALGANKEQAPWYTLGPLVHNREVVEHLKSQGIDSIDAIEGIGAGGVIIRSHGVPPEVYDSLDKSGLNMVDATCPLVKKVQELAHRMAESGYQLVIIGDSEHPEVKGIAGWAGDAIIISSVAEAAVLPSYDKLAVVSQTTKTEELYKSIVEELAHHAEELKTFNTICGVSSRRQSSAAELAGQVGLMIVIGDRNSSNTRSLVKVCEARGVPTYHIETKEELRYDWFQGIEKVGVTAGASTPDWVIKEVLDRMSDLGENVVKDEQPETEYNHTEATFAQMEAEMAESLQSVERGTILKGVIIQVTDNEAMVDVGGKSEGVIPLRELSVRDIDSAKEIVKVGDEVNVMILRWDDDGTIVVSKRRVDQEKALDTLEEAFEKGTTVAGTVVKEVKGGLLVDVGVVGFLPASQIGEGYVKDLSTFIGQQYGFKIVEFNRGKRRGSQVVVSRRKALDEEKNSRKQEFWNDVVEGQIRTGVVKKLTDYGAFIDIGGFEGLLHISEIDYSRIEKPSDVLHEGQEVEVLILGIDPKTQRVSLSRKKVLQSPWHNITSRYNEGDIVTGKVVRTAQFGAFVELEPGIDGLVHISQMADRRIAKADDVVKVGQEIKVKILSVNTDERKIALSIKQVAEDAENEFVQEYLSNQEE